MQTSGKKPFKKRLRIWWHYHWIALLISLASLVLLLAVIRSLTGKTEPDYRIGVAARLELPVDTAEALKNALLPFCRDQNGDGQVVLELSQYTVDFDSSNASTNAYSQMAGVIKLSSDFKAANGCGIFLIEDVEGFVKNTAVLRDLDGSLPEAESGNQNWKDICYLWSNCPVLTSLDLGVYRGYTLMDTQEGNGQDVLKNFYLGRKAIPADTYTKKDDAEEELWQTITKDASRS